MAEYDDAPVWCNGHGKPEYILSAANHYNNGVKYAHQPRNISAGFVVCGRRHHNCILTYSMTVNRNKDYRPPCVQGFLTSKDRFLNRQEAYELALACGQLKEESNNKTLMSEDLY